MTKATRVYITPPTSTSARHSRRSILGAIAGSAAAAGSIAGLSPAIASAAVIAPDPALALIAEKRAADVAYGKIIDAQDEAESCHGFDSDEALEASDRCEAVCHAVNELDWRLATTPPTTLAGVAAVLRFANEHEDAGGEWPNTDAVGPDGWHYQLRATMAAAIEAIIRQMGV